MLLLGELAEGELPEQTCLEISGRVIGTRGGAVIATLPTGQVGEFCHLIPEDTGRKILCEIVAFQQNHFILAPFDSIQGLGPQVKVVSLGTPNQAKLPEKLLGSVLDALGNPLGENSADALSTYPTAEPLRQRPRPGPALIDQTFFTGIRAIDAFCTLGVGQRIGLFASAGLGKSTLLSMIARNSVADVNVIALIGERGREAHEFVQQTLGPAGLKKSVVVVSTSDESAPRRKWAVQTANSIAQELRARGLNVLLLVDSITRLARALREIGLASGELPVRHGFPASVYAELPRIIEQAGKTASGSITAIYTVLTNQLHEDDPLADELKSLLDGHIVLSPELFRLGVKPALDPCLSISRLSHRLNSLERQAALSKIVRAFARINKDKDLIMMGGEPDAELKAALSIESELHHFLNQHADETCDAQITWQRCLALANKL